MKTTINKTTKSASKPTSTKEKTMNQQKARAKRIRRQRRSARIRQTPKTQEQRMQKRVLMLTKVTDRLARRRAIAEQARIAAAAKAAAHGVKLHESAPAVVLHTGKVAPTLHTPKTAPAVRTSKVGSLVLPRVVHCEFTPAQVWRRRYATEGSKLREQDERSATRGARRAQVGLLPAALERPSAPKRAIVGPAWTEVKTEAQRIDELLALVSVTACNVLRAQNKPVAKSVGAASINDPVFGQDGAKKEKSASPILAGVSMQEIVKCVFSGVTPVARFHNDGASESNSLGKYFGIVSIAIDEAGNFVEHNINLPSAAMFDERGVDMAFAFSHTNDTMNHGSLVRNEEGKLLQLVFQVNQSYKRSNPNASGHWFSQRWNRNQHIMGAGVQVIPAFMSYNEHGQLLNSSNVHNGTLDMEASDIRAEMYDALINGVSKSIDSNNIDCYTALKDVVVNPYRRYFFLVAADVTSIIGVGAKAQHSEYAIGGNHKHRFSVGIKDGAVVGDVVPDATNMHKQQRMYAQDMSLYHIKDINSVIATDAAMTFPWDTMLDLYVHLMGKDFVKTVACDKSLRYMVRTGKVNYALDLSKFDVKEVRHYLSRNGEPMTITSSATTVTQQVVAAAPIAATDTIETTATVSTPKDNGAAKVVDKVVTEMVKRGEYAEQLGNYYEFLANRYVTRELNDANWTDYTKDKVADWHIVKDKKLVCSVTRGNETYNPNYSGAKAAYACQRLLTAWLGVPDADNITDFTGVKWTAYHFECLVKLIQSYSIKDTMINWVAATNAEPSKLIIEGSFVFEFVDGIGVVTNRGQIFKNILQTSYTETYEKKKLVKTPTAISGTDSVGNFMRLFYYGYLPMLASQRQDYQFNLGANLNSFAQKADAFFPVTSDRTDAQNANALWSECSSWAPIGVKTTTSRSGVTTLHVPKPIYTTKTGQIGWIDFSVMQADRMVKQYKDFNRCEINDQALVIYTIEEACNQLDLSFSHHKGTGFSAPGTFASLRALRVHAPVVHAKLAERILSLNAQLKIEDLDDYIVNFNSKVEKGLKRIMLKCPTSVPSGSQLDFTDRPKLKALVEATSLPIDSKWNSMLPPDFHQVRYGSKISGQKERAAGTLVRVALQLTGIAPAGEAIYVGNQWGRPHGFVSKQCALPIKHPGTANPVVFEIGSVLCGVPMETYQQDRNGLTYNYFVPTSTVMVSGEGTDIIGHVNMGTEIVEGSGVPFLLPIRHERRGCFGVVEWVRYREVSSLVANTKELVIEWQVTWLEAQGKIRSSVKAMQLDAKKRFVMNSLNRLLDNPKNHIDSDLVQLVVPQDAEKADVMTSKIPMIGATLVYGVDCVHPEFIALRELAMDINEEVEGRRHLDYLYEDGASIAAGLYEDLFKGFAAFFGRQLWTNWEELETGDFGTSMLRNYEELVRMGKMHLVTDLSFLGNSMAVSYGNRMIVIAESATPTADANDKSNVFVFWINAAGKVCRLFQRAWALVGRDNCPIYDVVLYESSTVRESAGDSRQLGVNIRSLPRVHDDNEFALDVQHGQSNDGLMDMYRTKLIMACKEAAFAEDTSYKIVSLGKFEGTGKKAVYTPNMEAIAEINALLAPLNIGMRTNDSTLFGDIATALASYVIEVNSAIGVYESEEDSEGNEIGSYLVDYRKVHLWTPFLYDLNSLKSENNSVDNLSGRFFAYLINAVQGVVTPLEVSQIVGKLDAIASSEGTRKYIGGSDTVIGKVITLPNCPTEVILISEDSEQYDLMSQLARKQGCKFNPPSWPALLAHGLDVFTPENTVFNHETRSPLADGPLGMLVALPQSEAVLNNFFYSISETCKQRWCDGETVGEPQLVMPYPFTRNISVAGHTCMTSGDADGDGTGGAIIRFANAAEWKSLRDMVTTFEFAWNYRESAVGGHGAMTKLGVYLGDHLTCKSALEDVKKNKLEIYSQKDWLKEGKALILRADYNQVNYRARLMFSTFVGVAYGVYQLGEGAVEISRAMHKAGYDLKNTIFTWCLEDSALEVVKAVSELYEIILGATDEAGWTMYDNYFVSVMQGKFDKSEVDVAVFAEAMSEMKANPVYAVEVLECLQMLSNIKHWEHLGEKLELSGFNDLIVAMAYAQFEIGRGKWVGYTREDINGNHESDNKREAQRVVIQFIKDALKNARVELFAKACDYSHILSTLATAFTSCVLGDIITERNGITFRNEDGDAPALFAYMQKLQKRCGTQTTEEIGTVNNPVASVEGASRPLESTQTFFGEESNEYDDHDDFAEMAEDCDWDDCDMDEEPYTESPSREAVTATVVAPVVTEEPAAAPVVVAPTVAPVVVVQPTATLEVFTPVQLPIEQFVNNLSPLSAVEAMDAKVEELLRLEAEGKALTDARAALLVKIAKLSPESLASLGIKVEPFDSKDDDGGNVVVKPTPKPTPKPNGGVSVALPKSNKPAEPAAKVESAEPIGAVEPATQEPTVNEPKFIQADMVIKKVFFYGNSGETTLEYHINGEVALDCLEASRCDDVVVPALTTVESGNVRSIVFIAFEKEQFGWVKNGMPKNMALKAFGIDGSWDASEYVIYVGNVSYIDETVTTAPITVNLPVANPAAHVTAKKSELEVQLPITQPVTTTTISQPLVTPSAEVPIKATHTACQTKFFETLAEGRHVFLTGKAGTGKTYATIEAINNWSANGDSVLVLGSTGISVMNMGGSLEEGSYSGLATVNSCFGLGLGFDEDRRNNETDWQWANHLIARAETNSYVKQLLSCKPGQRLRVVIDEISMLDARLIWVVWQIIRKINPLAQVLMVGDGGQLKAVGKMAIQFFKQATLAGFNGKLDNILELFQVIRLETNCRQANDRTFAEALDHLWEHNELTGVLLERFQACLNGDKPKTSATHIRFNNITVEAINKQMTDALTTEKRTYKGTVRNIGARNTNWLKDFAPISQDMTLAVGMPVKLRKNRRSTINNKIVLEAANGSRGIITQLKENSVLVDFDGKILEVERVKFTGRKLPNGSISGIFEQLPIHPDFASTGHSCQGLTIKNPVIIGVYEERVVRKESNMTKNADGSIKTTKLSLRDSEWLYVTCSRVTKAEDLFFDCSDANTVNLYVQSVGGKDTDYINWLNSRLNK